MAHGLTLDGRTAIVTGAGQRPRPRRGDRARRGRRQAVVLNDLPCPAVHAVADEITAAGGQAVVMRGRRRRLGDRRGDARCGPATTFGGLDIVVNNAGVLRDRMVFTMSPQEWDLVLRVHLRGHFITTRLATGYWREQSKRAGGPVYARIVNTSSEAFLLGSAGQPNYAAAKAGIVALTVTTARSCARYGVRANAICPRARTDMTADLMGTAPEGAVDPLAPEHVAPLVTYLAGPAAAAINGEVFVVHGGVAAVLDPPRMRTVFRAAEHGSADGMWTLDSVTAALGPSFGDEPSGAGFACEDTLSLAERDHRLRRLGRCLVKQRDQVAMTDDEAIELLAVGRKVQLATNGPDGYPHLVTMYYVLIDGLITFWTYRKSQKALNLERDPRISCLVEDGEEYFDLRGVLVQGTVRRIEDPAVDRRDRPPDHRA